MESIIFHERKQNGQEVTHRANVIVCRRGKTESIYGDPRMKVVLHSLAKPFQIVPLLKDPALSQFALSGEDLALLVGSHNGEKDHRDRIRDILQRAELPISALKCGIHAPYFAWQIEEWRKMDDDERTIANNCSGKHLSMLLQCKLMDCLDGDYRQVDHPVQLRIKEELQRFCGTRIKNGIDITKDGCGVPAFILDLMTISDLYLQLATQDIFSSVKDAMLRFPFYTAGTGRTETHITNEYQILTKTGAEGLYAMLFPNDQIVIVIKVLTGDEYASEFLALYLLKERGIISSSKLDELKIKFELVNFYV